MSSSIDVSALARQFWDDGYLLLEGFFKPHEVDPLDVLIRDHFGESPDFRHRNEFLHRSETEVIPWFPQQEGVAAFDSVDETPALAALTDCILGEAWERLYCMVMFSRAGTRGQAWHQDCPPEDPAVFNLNRLVYTRDITEEVGGATVVVPGTHRHGVLPAGAPHDDLPGQRVLRPRKGTLVLLHGHTWHRVLPIRGACRYSANYRAAPRGLGADITDVCVYRNMRYRFSTAQVIEEREAPSP